MSTVFIEKIPDVQIASRPLIGLESQRNLLKEFCKFAWSEKWKDQSSLLHFMPTILLHGPPGTGKTSLIKDLATVFSGESFKYYRESLDLLVDKNLGETSKAIKNLFDELREQAECGKKVLLQVDDIDSILSSRYLANDSPGVRRGVNTFLNQLDELLMESYQFTPVVAATTNMLDLLDSAVKRRFSLKMRVDPELQGGEVRELIQPMTDAAGVEGDIDFQEIAEISLDRQLTPGDLILVMQDVFLRSLTGTKFSAEHLLEEFRNVESSTQTFELQRKSLSLLYRGCNG